MSLFSNTVTLLLIARFNYASLVSPPSPKGLGPCELRQRRESGDASLAPNFKRIPHVKVLVAISLTSKWCLRRKNDCTGFGRRAASLQLHII